MKRMLALGSLFVMALAPGFSEIEVAGPSVLDGAFLTAANILECGCQS
jgi:hypothetical protein